MDNTTDILDELNNDKYVSKIETLKNKKIRDKEIDIERKNDKKKLQNELLEQKIKDKKEQKKNEDSEEVSQINGKLKLQQINTIQKYKLLFPELKDFKYKRSSNSEELAIVISELQNIVELSSVDDFLLNSIYDTLLMIEPYSVPTRANITGISTMLRLNPNFNIIVKKLILKYDFSNSTSPEMQLLIIITTSLYMVIQKNNGDSRKNMDQYLNEKI